MGRLTRRRRGREYIKKCNAVSPPGNNKRRPGRIFHESHPLSCFPARPGGKGRLAGALLARIDAPEPAPRGVGLAEREAEGVGPDLADLLVDGFETIRLGSEPTQPAPRPQASVSRLAGDNYYSY